MYVLCGYADPEGNKPQTKNLGLYVRRCQEKVSERMGETLPVGLLRCWQAPLRTLDFAIQFARQLQLLIMSDTVRGSSLCLFDCRLLLLCSSLMPGRHPVL